MVNDSPMKFGGNEIIMSTKPRSREPPKIDIIWLFVIFQLFLILSTELLFSRIRIGIVKYNLKK